MAYLSMKLLFKADAALYGEQETKKLRRLTRQMDLETKEIKIDTQLSNFLSSMVKLEEEWKKQGRPYACAYA